MRALAAAGAVALVLVAASPVLGAQKTGCPVGTGWDITTVEDAAATIWPELLDPSAFPGGQDQLEAELAGFDRSGDGSLCMKTMGGEDTNPNSHWYLVGVEILGSPTVFFTLRDNNSAPS